MAAEKIWLKSYPEGVPAEIPTPPFRSVRDMIEFSLREYADRPAYTNMGTTMTFADLDRLSMEFAGYLQKELKLMKGERVAIMLPNVLQYPVVLCGIFRAGLVAVNVNPLYTARELKHQLADSGAKCIVILENFAHILAEVIGETKVQHVVTTGVGDLLKWPKGLIVNIALKHLKKAVPAFSLPGSVSMKKALKTGRGNAHLLTQNRAHSHFEAVERARHAQAGAALGQRAKRLCDLGRVTG
jgi:long-chain acyl-CoA synthetase